MEIQPRHTWDLSPSQARELQTSLAASIKRRGAVRNPSYVAGVDVSVLRRASKGRAAIVVLKYPSLEVIDTALHEGDIRFPYIPGLLSFREAPLILEAWKKLAVRPDLLMVDGHGIAHPRRLGLASHLGLLLDVATIGCAKSRLIGSHGILEDAPGSHTPLIDKGEIIGAVVRTRNHVKPLYISIGHKIGLGSCIEMVLKCCRGYRLPEPARMAHMAAGAVQQRHVI